MLLPMANTLGLSEEIKCEYSFDLRCLFFFFYFHHSRNLLTFLPNITQARTVAVEESLLFFNVDAVFVFLFACLLWSQGGFSI